MQDELPDEPITTDGQRVAKNAGILMISQLATWGLTLLLTIFLNRFLGPEGVGKLNTVNALWAIVTIFVTFGMNTYMTREIARDNNKIPTLFAQTIWARVFLFFLSFWGVVFYLHWFAYPPDTIQIAYILAANAFIWELNSAIFASLEGLEQMRSISVGNVIGKAFNTILSLILLFMGYGIVTISIVIVLSGLATLIVPLRTLGKQYSLRPTLDLKGSWHMLKAGLPFLGVALSIVVYLQVDVIIISLLVNEETVGWYSSADQLFATLLFVPTVFMTAVYPALARMFTNDPNAMPRLLRKSFHMLLILGVPIGFGIIIVAQPLVILLFGPEFAPSGAVLMILGVVLIFTYQNILLGQFLIATERQNKWTRVMIIATIATIFLDIFLIPFSARAFGNGAIGGAIAFVITETFQFLVGVRMLPAGSLDRHTLSLAGRTIIAGIGMLIITWWARSLFIILPIAIGAVSYALLLLLLKIITREDITLLQNATENFSRRFRRPTLATKTVSEV
jgi:O-antigen/teichoic acid export membrane protein